MILVTGGTGFVGQEIVRELLTRGYRVRLLVRRPHALETLGLAHHPRLDCVQGDALKPETLAGAMVGVQAVIHLIGIIAETSKVSFEQAHFEATRHVLTAARQAGVTRWVQMSAIGTRPEARSRYHQTKWQAEEFVRQSGLDWTIFRPSLIYGYDERDRLLNLLRLVLSPPLDFLQLYSFPLLNGGQVRIQPVSVREVAACFAQAPAKAASVGQTFDLVGPSPLTWRGLIGVIAAHLGKKTTFEEIPLLLLLRALLWLGLAILPFLLVGGMTLGKINLVMSELAALIWVILVTIAFRWRSTLLFNVPSEPLLLVGEALSHVTPPQLQFSEQLKMAQEDNVGDPVPAATTFAYTPESFSEGVARCYAAQPRS